MKRKQCIAIVGAVALRILCETGLANADDWPVRPVTMIVPFGAGSASDTVGRVMAAALSGALGQQVIVENIAGATGMTGPIPAGRRSSDYLKTLMVSETEAWNKVVKASGVRIE